MAENSVDFFVSGAVLFKSQDEECLVFWYVGPLTVKTKHTHTPPTSHTRLPDRFYVSMLQPFSCADTRTQ